MPGTPDLRTATCDELTQSLSFAIRLNGRKHAHDADEVIARITAERLAEHLERSAYVVMSNRLGRPTRRRGICHRCDSQTAASGASSAVSVFRDLFTRALTGQLHNLRSGARRSRQAGSIFVSPICAGRSA